MRWREKFRATIWVLRAARSRAGRWTRTGLVLVVVLSWAVLYSYDWYGRLTAGRLLLEIRRVQRGAPFASVEPLIAQYGFEISDQVPCNKENCTFAVIYRRGWADGLLQQQHWSRYVGLRPFWYGASIDRRGDLVGATSFSIITEIEPDEWASVSVEEVSEPTWMRLRKSETGIPDEARLHVGWSNLKVLGAEPETGEAMPIIVSPYATSDDRAIAYALDMSCLSAFGGCGNVCRLAPLAWLVGKRHRDFIGRGSIPASCAHLVPQ
jgi:hypothetical protein